MNRLIYNPVTEVSRLLAPEYAVMVSLISGYNEISGPSEAAVMLPLPTPVAMANDKGLIGRMDANNPDARPINIAPKIVPKMYTAMMPLPSGDEIPYFSVMIARLGSLPIE